MTAESTSRRPAWFRLLPLLGLCLLAWVLSRLDLRALSDAFGRVSLLTIALSCAWFTFNLWLKVYRWQRLLFAQGIRLPHRVALAAFMSAQFYAQVTVGRVGEFVRIEALTERGIGAGTALSSCIFDRLLDVFVVLFAGSVLGAFVLGAARAALAAALVMALLALFALWFVRRVGREPGASPPLKRAQRSEASSRARLQASNAAHSARAPWASCASWRAACCRCCAPRRCSKPCSGP